MGSSYTHSKSGMLKESKKKMCLQTSPPYNIALIQSLNIATDRRAVTLPYHHLICHTHFHSEKKTKESTIMHRYISIPTFISQSVKHSDVGHFLNLGYRFSRCESYERFSLCVVNKLPALESAKPIGPFPDILNRLLVIKSERFYLFE